jgi:hypothetical protein
MRNKFLLLVAVVVSMTVPLFAHHGNAAYDYEKKVTVSGVVTQYIWANPHCWLKFDGKDDKGQVQHWVVEASNPPDQTREGWTYESFKPGDQVTITMIQAKNGEPIGRFVANKQGGKIILNGKPFPAGSENTTSSDAGAAKP